MIILQLLLWLYYNYFLWLYYNYLWLNLNTDRRYMVIMTSSEKIGDKEYFQQGFEYLNDTKAMYSMYKFLKERNVPKRLDFH